MNDPKMQPGCFGSALTYRPNHPGCHGCPFAVQCAPEANRRLELLRSQFGIKVKKRKHLTVSEQVTKEGLALIGEVPVKVAEFLERCDRAGIRITESLRNGENPFARKPAHMRLACHLLLRLPDGLSTDTLRSVLQKKMDWSEGTANSYMIQACQTLVAVGAAEQREDRLYLKQ